MTAAAESEAPARREPPREAQIGDRRADALAAVLMAFVAMQTVGVVMIPVVAPFLQERFSASDAQIGLLTSAFALAVALASIPMGLATARWGGRTLVIAAAFFITGSLMLATAGSYEWLLAGRFVQGLGAGAGMPVGTALITRLVSPARRHRAFGLFGAGTGVGTVGTLLLLPTVAESGGYAAVCAAVAVFGVGLGAAALSLRALRARPVYRDAPAARALLRSLARAAGSGRVLLIALMNFTVVAVVVGILTWTPQFFHDQFGSSLAVAAYLTAAIGVSQTVGNPLGALAMKRWSKPAVLVAGLALTALATALVPAGTGAVVAFITVLVTVLLAGAVLPPSLAVVGDVAHGNESMGASTGLIGLLNVVGSMIAPWAFGALLDTYGTAPGDPGYAAGYLMLAGFCAVGALGAVVFALLQRRPVARS